MYTELEDYNKYPYANKRKRYVYEDKEIGGKAI
jgi:hypothetical protein